MSRSFAVGVRPLVDCHWERIRVALTTIAGDRLELEFDGVHRLNGEIIDYAAWPLYGAPEAEAELHTGRMRFGRGEDVVDVDFDIDPDQPMMPMRVIG